MKRCALQRYDSLEGLANLVDDGVPLEALLRFQTGVHAFEGEKKRLSVILSIDRFALEEAHLYHLGIRDWLHVSVSVVGQNRLRLEDQKKLGRKREAGERSPVPLPDWYDLTHIVYGHPELGFKQDRDVYQVLPAPGRDYANFAEALHLRQPL